MSLILDDINIEKNDLSLKNIIYLLKDIKNDPIKQDLFLKNEEMIKTIIEKIFSEIQNDEKNEKNLLKLKNEIESIDFCPFLDICNLRNNLVKKFQNFLDISNFNMKMRYIYFSFLFYQKIILKKKNLEIFYKNIFFVKKSKKIKVNQNFKLCLEFFPSEKKNQNILKINENFFLTFSEKELYINYENNKTILLDMKNTTKKIYLEIHITKEKILIKITTKNLKEKKKKILKKNFEKKKKKILKKNFKKKKKKF